MSMGSRLCVDLRRFSSTTGPIALCSPPRITTAPGPSARRAQLPWRKKTGFVKRERGEEAGGRGGGLSRVTCIQLKHTLKYVLLL